MESLASRQESAQAPPSQVPPIKHGNSFDWRMNRADANRTAEDVTCCSTANTMLVLYFARETSSIHIDACSFG